jgi:Fur family transcriptional regulator, peroxide stress response regulator
MLKKAQKTAQREAIMCYLKDNRNHPSVADIYAAVSEQLGTISLTTVYNTLMLLEKEGLLKEIPVHGSSGKRFDPNSFPHDHLICTSCGSIVDIPQTSAINISPEYLHGFEIQEISVKVYGLCSACKNKPEATLIPLPEREGTLS